MRNLVYVACTVFAVSTCCAATGTETQKVSAAKSHVARAEAKGKEVQETVKNKEAQEIGKVKTVRDADKGKAGKEVVNVQEKKLARNTPIDLNSASKKELINLPGIGEVLAERIIKARPFKSVDDIKKVDGIGLERYSEIKELVVVK